VECRPAQLCRNIVAFFINRRFGHQDTITDLDTLTKERCVTTGGRDRTLRLWKIADESHLLFRIPGDGSIDCVAMLDEEHFVTGSDSG
jgi:ribosomal RNA-processing protein 9